MRAGRLSTNIQISLILFLLGVWAVPAPFATAQDDTLTGWFTFIVADYPSEDGLVSETTYVLTEDSGERHELLIDTDLMRPLGGPVALNRKRVTVEGEWEQSGAATEQFRVNAIELAVSLDVPSVLEASPDGASTLHSTSQAAVTDSHVRGSQAWVTILCRFGDATDVTPHPVSYYEDWMRSSEPQLGHYWKEVSYGNIPDLSGSRVVGWYNLPRPRSYYVYDKDGDGEEDQDEGRLIDDCIATGDADVFFPDFWGINLVFNGDIVVGGFASSRRLTKDGQTRFWSVTAISRDAGIGVVAHEMGHAFGLMHSSGPYGQDDPWASPTTYDSKWDVMSGIGSCRFPDPEYGCVGVHTIAYHKDFLGWIPSSRKYVAPRNSTRTITLERLAQPGPEGYLMAQIPIGRSRTDFYTVEARLFAGYDDEIPDEAVVIHKVDTTRADRLAQVVDIDNNGDPNDEGAMWTVGETFTDLGSGVQVSVDAEYETGFQVTIAYSICAEALSSTRQLIRGRAGIANVRVGAPSGCRWAATSNSPWITIIAGSGNGNGQVSYAVAANPSLKARTGTLTIAGRILTVTQAGINDNLFEDDMESGANGWYGQSPWALTTTVSHSGAHAWTDSPGGNYRNDKTTELYSPLIDLNGVDSATLTFWHRYDFASGTQGHVRLHWGNGEWQDIRRFTGTNSTWQQVSLDLSSFAGRSLRISFTLGHNRNAPTTADGWYIDDVAVFSSDFEKTEPLPPPRQATLENPAPASFQSGISVISGWACQAQEIVIELNGMPLPAAYGTEREAAVQQVCGHSDAGFSLLWNWNNLGAGTHTVRALLDGVEFANTTVQVTTFGEQFLQGESGRFNLPNFPTAGEAIVVQWEESLQNFVITDGQPNPGGGYNQVAGVNARLENPSLGSAQSGISAISGWACAAEEIVIELNGVPLSATYGTEREPAVEQICGHSDAGFGLLWNWNNLGPGTHRVRALVDGVEFANTTVRVTTFGEPFRRGLSGTFPIPDFPRSGENKRLRWAESLQNFVIIP